MIWHEAVRDYVNVRHKKVVCLEEKVIIVALQKENGLAFVAAPEDVITCVWLHACNIQHGYAG
jgi:hypothetical protein